MFWNKKKFFLLFLFVYNLLNANDFHIKELFPINPYIGTRFIITGDGFEGSAKVKLFFNHFLFEYDSLNLISWNDKEIILILPDLKKVNYIKLLNKEKSISKLFFTERLLNVEYFNSVKYTLQYMVNIDKIENKNKEKSKIYIYIPQPILSDELISKNIISIKPAPEYIQDNGILIYEIDPSNQKSFHFEEIIEITTSYKKINFDNTVDTLPYVIDSQFYQYYTKEEPPFIIPNNPIIKEKLNQIIGKEDNTLEKIKLIYEWVVKKMSHEYPTENRSPLYSIKTGKGDCLSDAFLFASLIRAAGIPVRLNSGYIFYHTWKVGGLHYWEDVFAPGIGWINIDISFSHSPDFLKNHDYPTKKDFYFGATDGRRMAFSNGRIRLMKPDDKGKLVFYKYFGNMQAPRVIPSEKDVKINYKMKKKLLIKNITPLYDLSDDWFFKK